MLDVAQLAFRNLLLASTISTKSLPLRHKGIIRCRMAIQGMVRRSSRGALATC
jgi:hypothetical protein